MRNTTSRGSVQFKRCSMTPTLWLKLISSATTHKTPLEPKIARYFCYFRPFLFSFLKVTLTEKIQFKNLHTPTTRPILLSLTLFFPPNDKPKTHHSRPPTHRAPLTQTRHPSKARQGKPFIAHLQARSTRWVGEFSILCLGYSV